MFAAHDIVHMSKCMKEPKKVNRYPTSDRTTNALALSVSTTWRTIHNVLTVATFHVVCELFSRSTERNTRSVC